MLYKRATGTFRLRADYQIKKNQIRVGAQEPHNLITVYSLRNYAFNFNIFQVEYHTFTHG
jgi:hypothetical protein